MPPDLHSDEYRRCYAPWTMNPDYFVEDPELKLPGAPPSPTAQMQALDRLLGHRRARFAAAPCGETRYAANVARSRFLATMSHEIRTLFAENAASKGLVFEAHWLKPVN